MLFMHVNVWALLAAAVASMVIGFLWYSPLLFAKPWMVAMGYDPLDPGPVGGLVQRAFYSRINPPVSSDNSWILCSTQYVWSSSTIFSVAHGSQ